MIRLVGEAVAATVQPCTLLLIVPTCCAVAAAGARWSALGAALVGAVAGGWMVAANWFVVDGWLLRVTALGAAAVLLWMVVPSPPVPQVVAAAGAGRPFVAPAVAAVAFAATTWWRPCVGAELGRVLTAAQDDLIGQLAPMAVYVLGAMSPVIALVLVVEVAGRPRRPVAIVARSAAVLGMASTLVLAAGRHDELTGALSRLTNR